MNSKKSGAYLLLLLALIKLIVDAAFWAVIVVLLILFGLQFPHSAKLDSLSPVMKLHLWVDPVLALVGSKVSREWPASDVSYLPIGCGLALLAVKVCWDAVMLRLTRFAQKRLPLSEESLALSSSASSKGISVSSTLLALAVVSDKAAAKIQRRYARVERRLGEMKHRHCAFLSVAVVEAEEMKLGATPDKVARSFDAYEKMLEQIFQVTGAWKEAWTPEGVMVCFLDVRRAVDAGQRVLNALDEFNTNRNEISQPFRVCCGVNEGDVVIFEDSKLQKVADRVIDVAGHMMKKARPNTLWLSSDIYDRLEEKPGFHPANAKVDGFTVFEWRAEPDSSLQSKAA